MLVVSKAIYVRVTSKMSLLLLNIVLYIVLFASVLSLLPWEPVVTVVTSLVKTITMDTVLFCHSGRLGASIYLVVSNLVVYRDFFQLGQCYLRWLRIPMLPCRNHDSRHCRNEVAWCSSFV